MDDKLTGSGFSVEMESKKHVRTISLLEVGHEEVLFEGDLAELVELGVLEEAVLTVNGAHGALRIDINEKGLKRANTKHRSDTEES